MHLPPVPAIAPLVDWKTRKGWPRGHRTTDVTGASTDGIKAWLQDAYDTWATPPEYVLLVGDVDAIPTWSFSGNVTDLPYALLDGDDWLPDVMLGRFPVSNQSEARPWWPRPSTTSGHPNWTTTAWFTRGVMVAGHYASDTPSTRCASAVEQLDSIGFDPLDPVTPAPGVEGNYIVSPFIAQEGIGVPQNMGPAVIKAAIDEGCSMVVYRGWAYGTAGWDPPHFTVDDIPYLDNGAMTPGRHELRLPQRRLLREHALASARSSLAPAAAPTEPFKGAVAFIGNGEHWSHTRYNDAMAISFFERIVEYPVTDLGTLLNAGKLRFMDYFPNEISAAENGEESVEFYFHIYNLMGDPSLKFWRQLPET